MRNETYRITVDRPCLPLLWSQAARLAARCLWLPAARRGAPGGYRDTMAVVWSGGDYDTYRLTSPLRTTPFLRVVFSPSHSAPSILFPMPLNFLLWIKYESVGTYPARQAGAEKGPVAGCTELEGRWGGSAGGSAAGRHCGGRRGVCIWIVRAVEWGATYERAQMTATGSQPSPSPPRLMQQPPQIARAPGSSRQGSLWRHFSSRNSTFQFLMIYLTFSLSISLSLSPTVVAFP